MLILLQKILLGVSLAAPLGPVSIEVIRRGLKRGFMAAFVVALGSALGDFACLLVTYLGFARFVAIPSVKMVIWVLGSLVLLFLGTKSIIESKNQNILQGDDVDAKGKNAFFLGFALALANPISVVWWLGVFGVVLGDSSAEAINFASFLSNTTIILGVVLWFLFLSSFLNFGKRFINESRLRWISILAGLCLICFGLNFGYRAISILLS
jgi:threonine/homoserine/homoserine lactone efflux protein